MQLEQSLRIDTADLKAQMLKRMGPERFKRYFYYLNRFLSQRLSKSDFDRLCYWTLGRENLPLHNRIIRSILKNASNAKTPPPVREVGLAKSALGSGETLSVLVDGHGQGSFAVQNQTLPGPLRSNGILLPLSPQKSRSGVRDRKIKDSSGQVNGKAESGSVQSTGTGDSSGKTVENGNVIPCDYQRPMQQHQGLAEKPENEDVLDRGAPDNPLHSKPNPACALEDGEEVEQGGLLGFPRNPLLAPLGIPFCSATVGVARRSLPMTNTSGFDSCYDCGTLPDTEILRKRMGQIATAQGLGGVTSECSSVLNNMLDLYLKRLIRSCVEVVGAGSGSHANKYPVQNQRAHGRLIDGPWPSNHLHLLSGIGTLEEQRTYGSVSLVDIKVAMELNPRQLGGEWPSLLEKISMQSFEE